MHTLLEWDLLILVDSFSGWPEVIRVPDKKISTIKQILWIMHTLLEWDLLILVDSFSGWPEVIRAPDKKISTIKQILRVIFSRNGIPKTLVSDNAPEFCDEDLNLRLEKNRVKTV